MSGLCGIAGRKKNPHVHGRLGQERFLDGNEILTGPGKISHEEAKLHAETEYEKYRLIQDRLFESDFDRVVKQIGESDEQ